MSCLQHLLRTAHQAPSICATRNTPLTCTVRHGHMVNLPGNVWSTKPWIKTLKKKKYQKGTAGLKLDSIKTTPNLKYRHVDPKKIMYAYQISPLIATHNCDPIGELCKLTKSALPIALSQLDDNTELDQDYHSNFNNHIVECCESFNRTYNQKELPTNLDSLTPLQLATFSLQYSTGFLHNLLNFLYSDSRSGDLLLHNSHTSFNQNTAAFWRVNVLRNGPAQSNFQFTNHLDMMLRTSSPLSFTALQTASSESVHFKESNAQICTPRLHLFKQEGNVEQYPGFMKETLYPYNHTVFKVIAGSIIIVFWYSVSLGKCFKTFQGDNILIASWLIRL